ncbi:MAG TPA: FHA domain-containing protein [Planctomycetota bacterium]|nr:FHA domain-containing protein [Planctomycetota bacterium]
MASESSPRGELFVLSGPDVGRSFEIRDGATLGRAPDRAVVMRDKSISRHHAHFEHAGGVWAIVDDGSTNGFLVDGVRSQRAELANLREFLVGEVLVRLRTQVAETAPAPAVVSAPPPRHEEEIVIEDEILLDQAPEPTVATIVSRPVAPPPSPRAAPARSSSPAPNVPRSTGEAGFTAKNQRALQYHKQEARSGLLVTDLAQQPLWKRGLVIAVTLGLAALLAYGMYRGVLALRDHGAASEAPEDA